MINFAGKNTNYQTDQVIKKKCKKMINNFMSNHIIFSRVISITNYFEISINFSVNSLNLIFV